ncbi:MAG: ABC transporter substrate-binding protein [Eubacteriales bacterium]|nr:ABC transporter substrate-binding protein [Eubacteriales bacterium]
MRKKSLSKILALGMVAAMTAGLLAGCGGSGSTTTDNGAATPATDGAADNGAGDSASTGEVPTLIWWTVGGTPADDFDEAVSQISDYAEEKIGVRIDVKIAGWGDYDTKMNNIINTGEYFDLMFVNNTNYSKFVNLNALENITDLVQSETPDLYNFIPTDLWEGAQIHGNVYAVPTYKDSSITQFWYLDDTYVQKYGIDMETVKDYAGLDAAVRTIKEGEGSSVYPIQLAQGSLFNGFFNNYDGLASGLQPIGVRFDDESRKVVCTLEQDDIKEQLDYLHTWYMDGFINPDANVISESNKGAIFGTAQGWPAAASTWEKNMGVEKYDLTKVFGPVYTTESIQGSMNAISVNSKYKKEALKVLELMNTDSKFRDMCAYGTEGNYMQYESDGTVTRLRDDWNWPSYTQGTFFILSTLSDGDPEAWKQVEQQNEEATPSSCLGFALDVTNIQNEMSNCNTVWDKYKYDLLTGASDPAQVLDQCISELKSAGLDTIIAEAQKQIDEFFAE